MKSFFRKVWKLFMQHVTFVLWNQIYLNKSRKKRLGKAMDEEIVMIEKNETGQLLDKPQEKEIIDVKWIYEVK